VKLFGNPFIAQDLSSAYTRPQALRSYLAVIAAMSGVLMIWWPRSPLASYLRSGMTPDTFFAAAIGLLGCMTYVSVRFGAEDFAEENSSQIHDFVTLTPVPVSSVVAGKLVTAVLHTLFLLVLGLPFLVIGSSVNGTSIAVIGRAALVMGFYALAFRMYAFLAFVLFEPRKVFKDAVLILSALVSLIVTTSAFPPLSPISAILSLNPDNAYPTVLLPLLGTPFPFHAVSVIINALLTAVFSISSGVWLRAVRRAHAGRQPAPPEAPASEKRAERFLRGQWDDEDDKPDGTR
jgi:hypothetical protein